MSMLPGRWLLTMRTPIGRIEAEMTFTEEGGHLGGTASGTGETVPLREVTSEPADAGERVTWQQSISRPLRLNLTFEVQVVGDEMHGSSRAGRLPRSAVQGRRVGA